MGKELEKIRKLKGLYFTERDNLSDDFSDPCLNYFQKYDRAAGYFSSSALCHWAANITRLTNDENISTRLLISPKISEFDYTAFRDAVSEEKRKEIPVAGRTRFLAEAILWESGEVEPAEKEFEKILAWLITQERLEVRFAFNLPGGEEAGIFQKRSGSLPFPGGIKLLSQARQMSAIKDGILCPVDYFPISYQLTNDERSDLKKVLAREPAAAVDGNPWPKERCWMELSRAYKKAREKPSVFAVFLKDYEDDEVLKSTIIFDEDKEFGGRLYDTLIRYTHLYSQHFDSDDPSVQKRFAKGELDCLVTCHKISQGIDVPSLGDVVLFSSQKSRRETIQRLGRCLRSDRLIRKKLSVSLISS